MKSDKQLTGKELLSHLTKITITARRNATEAKALFDESLAKKIEEERLKAKPIIAKIVDLCVASALKKEDKAVVMTLIPGDDEGFSDIYDDKKQKPTWRNLGFKAEAVFDYIQGVLKLPVEIVEKQHFLPDLGYEPIPPNFKPVTYEMTVSWPGQEFQERY